MADDVIIQKLQEHDKRFDEHDRRFDEHDKRFDAHDQLFDRIITKLIEHDEKFEHMVTKKEFSEFQEKVMTQFDEQLVILKRLDEERYATIEWLKRLDQEVEDHRKKIDNHAHQLQRIRQELKLSY